MADVHTTIQYRDELATALSVPIMRVPTLSGQEMYWHKPCATYSFGNN